MIYIFKLYRKKSTNFFSYLFILRLKLIFNKFDEAARNGGIKDEGK
jgi:hypothetical protein